VAVLNGAVAIILRLMLLLSMSERGRNYWRHQKNLMRKGTLLWLSLTAGPLTVCEQLASSELLGVQVSRK
jgi:hypothetical protein